MLNINNPNDIDEMKNYYRTSDMINLINFFPEVSPIENLTIVKDEVDFIKNKEFIDNLDTMRIDFLKGRNIVSGIETTGLKDDFLPSLKRVKEKDSEGVIVLFNVNSTNSERYNRLAGITVGIDIGENVYIDAVGKGFDGREVSKSICTHERYYIPWFKLRECCIGNFKNFQTFQITDEEYKKTRLERIKFLESLGLNYEIVSKYIPETYTVIPDIIWLDLIKNILKKLEKNEDYLINSGFKNFAIGGHTEGNKFCPWQMFDKSRFELVKTKK